MATNLLHKNSNKFFYETAKSKPIRKKTKSLLATYYVIEKFLYSYVIRNFDETIQKMGG